MGSRPGPALARWLALALLSSPAHLATLPLFFKSGKVFWVPQVLLFLGIAPLPGGDFATLPTLSGRRLNQSPKRPVPHRTLCFLPRLSPFLGPPAPSRGVVQQSPLAQAPLLPASAGHLATWPTFLPRGRMLLSS